MKILSLEKDIILGVFAMKKDCLENGFLKVMPSAYYKNCNEDAIRLFCHMHGFYSLPTTELVEWLAKEFGDSKNLLEVGAGDGALARALECKAVDNMHMLDPERRAQYEAMGQGVTTYGPNVLKMDAVEGVDKFQPDAAIGCWITDRAVGAERGLEGGVDEEAILRKVDTYTLIGDFDCSAHVGKNIYKYPHRTVRASWLVSRLGCGGRNFIKVFQGIT